MVIAVGNYRILGGEKIRERRGSGSIIYMDIEITKDLVRSSDGENNSRPATRILRKS